MPKENDLEGQQDMGGKHGGQKGMPKPAPTPGTESPKGGVVGDPKTKPSNERPFNETSSNEPTR